MLTKLKSKNIIRYAVAVMVVLVLLVVAFYEKDRKQQYDIVILGDSVVGNVWGAVSVDTVLGERLGKSVFNGAFGGSCMSLPKQNMWGSMSNTEWSMVKLAETIGYDDWANQLAAMDYAGAYMNINLQALGYFPARMNDLSRIDFSRVEMLIIEHGTNDYNNGRSVDNPNDPYDVTTFGGALRYSLRLLQKTHPDMRIVLVSPMYCALGENRDLQCYDTSYGEGGILDDYVALEEQIAKEFGVEWIDAYHDSGIWEHNVDTYMVDALHPHVAGQEILANLIADRIEAVAK